MCMVEERRGRDGDRSLSKKEEMGRAPKLSSMESFIGHMAWNQGIAVFSAEEHKKRRFM